MRYLIRTAERLAGLADPVQILLLVVEIRVVDAARARHQHVYIARHLRA
jgi:hypothetical protein